MRSLLLALCLLPSALCLPAFAVDWTLVAGDDNSQYYVDNDSIKTNGVDYIYNTKVVDFNERDISVRSVRMNCRQQTTTVLTIHLFTIDGRFIKTIGGSSRPLAILEGTAPEIIYNNLCQ